MTVLEGFDRSPLIVIWQIHFFICRLMAVVVSR
jgi:hypothetical protein